MVDKPKLWSIQAHVLVVFQKHPNENLTREYIIDEASISLGRHLMPQQVDNAIQWLRNRGYRVFPTSPIMYGNLWARTFRLFTDENEVPPDFSRKRRVWSVVVPCSDESEARRLATALKQVLKVEIEVKRD